MSGAMQVVSLTPRERQALRDGKVYQSGDDVDSVVLVPPDKEERFRAFMQDRRLGRGTYAVVLSEKDLDRLDGRTDEPALVRTEDPAVVVCAREIERQVMDNFRAMLPDAEYTEVPREVDE